MDKWRVFGVVAAACCVSLAACDGDAGPVVTEPPPGTVTGTASPGETPAGTATPAATPTETAWLLEQLPADALTDDIEGATATAEFFLEQYAPMFHTGETSLWQALSGPECGYCADALANADEVHARGWTAEGGEIEPRNDASQSHVATSGRAYVYLPSHLSNAYLIETNGDRKLAEAASDHVYIVQLERLDGIWRVQGVKFGEE